MKPSIREMAEELFRRYRKTIGIPYCPHVPHLKQRQFLALDCREALFGGAAGPGKSDALLMAALQYINTPGYAAVIFRRTYADLSKPEALLDRSHEWFSGTDAKFDSYNKTWIFPSGAKLAFGYLDGPRDKFQHQGAAYQYCGFDELTQFEIEKYLYLFSRLRRLEGSDIPIRMRAASNPGGVGHDWVHERFIVEPGDRVFIPALLDDNPYVDADDYRKSLAELDETTRQQLLHGLWVRDSQSQLYRFDAVRNTGHFKSGPDWYYVLGIDLGASQAAPTTAFVVIAFSLAHPDTYVLHAEAKAGMYPASIADKIHKLMHDYGGFTEIVMDEGALGKGYGEEFRQRYSLPVQAAEKKNKLGYRKLINGDLERGRLKVAHGCNAELSLEMQQLLWDEKGLDNEKGQANHLTDAMLYAWRAAKHWAYERKDEEPEYGTEEWNRREEEKMFEECQNITISREGDY